MPQQPHVRLATGKSTAVAGGGQHRGLRSVPTVTAKATVLTNPELLMHIMSYEIGDKGKWDSQTTRRALGRMALVCRSLDEAARDKVFWEPLAKELIPRLADGDALEEGGTYRRYLGQYGCVLLNKHILDLKSWSDRLVLQFEILAGKDGHHIFSGEASLMREVDDEWTNLLIGARGRPFSAASRSNARVPSYGSIREYLEDMRTVKVRVTVHDTSTGRRGLLLDRACLRIEELVDDSHDSCWIVHSEQVPLSSVWFGVKSLVAEVRFDVESDPPDEEQEDVELDSDGEEQDTALPENQRPWRVVYTTLRFVTTDEVKVGRLVWAALGC